MRIARECFGIDRTTVVYDSDISGLGGNADEFFVMAGAEKVDGTIAARTTIVHARRSCADPCALSAPLSDRQRDEASHCPWEGFDTGCQPWELADRLGVSHAAGLASKPSL
jgi:hypothetical protein